jgi:AsmA protein
MALHKKKVLFITTGVIILAVLVGILALLLNLQNFTPQIEAAASTALGMDVRIKGSIGIALFPVLGLSLKDVNVRNNGLDVVTIEKMR